LLGIYRHLLSTGIRGAVCRIKTGSLFAKIAGKALKQALCTPCGVDVM